MIALVFFVLDLLKAEAIVSSQLAARFSGAAGATAAAADEDDDDDDEASAVLVL